MKTTITVCSAVILLFATGITTRADIIAGPITNPANGHDYYLLSPNTWAISEAEAESLDGALAVIKSVDEQKWIFSTFGNYGGTNRDLWIGLHRIGPDRSLVWVTGGHLDYVNWAGGQPDDAGGRESAVFMASANRPWGFEAGKWADMADNGVVDGSLPNGVVELPGKANELSLSKAERALIGNWYVGGDMERPCWITGTDKALFIISDSKQAARAFLGGDGILQVRNFQRGWPIMGDGIPMIESSRPGATQNEMRGEILKDKILWSNGTWWSRKPLQKTNKETNP